jgi:hypothetical protein
VNFSYLISLSSSTPVPLRHGSPFKSIPFCPQAIYFRFLITLFNLEVGRFYGDGAKYKSVWNRMNIMNKNAELLRKAVKAGLDPFTVELHDALQSGTPKGRGNKSDEISERPLFICTEHISLPFLRSFVDFC